MRTNRLIASVLLPASMCLLIAARCQAGSITVSISMDTSPLIGHPAGPFSLGFQLTDGSGLGDANNTANLSNFQFGAGGGTSGSPTLLGGASGDLSSGVTLTDSGFLNWFDQSFTPGDALSFTLTLSTNVDVGGTPDEFSFSILDSTGTELPTLGGPFFDVFVAIDIDSGSPTIQTFASDPTQSPAAGGPPIDMGAPQGTVVPEPGALVLFSTSLVLAALLARKRF